VTGSRRCERRTLLAACSGVVLGWVGVCTVSQGAQQGGERRVVVALPHFISRRLPSHAAARHTHHTARRGQCGDIHQHGWAVASCLSRLWVIRPRC
jgi:hypothetical protein